MSETELPPPMATYLDAAHIRGATITKMSERVQNIVETIQFFGQEMAIQPRVNMPRGKHTPVVSTLMSITNLSEFVSQIDQILTKWNQKLDSDGEPMYQSFPVEVELSQDGPITIRIKEVEFYIAPMNREKVEVSSLKAKPAEASERRD